MANMERIVRPHLPPNIAPVDKPPKCGVEPENVEAKLDKGTVSARANKETATYTHSAKWYMTRREREKAQPAEKEGDADHDMRSGGPGTEPPSDRTSGGPSTEGGPSRPPHAHEMPPPVIIPSG